MRFSLFGLIIPNQSHSMSSVIQPTHRLAQTDCPTRFTNSTDWLVVSISKSIITNYPSSTASYRLLLLFFLSCVLNMTNTISCSSTHSASPRSFAYNPHTLYSPSRVKLRQHNEEEKKMRSLSPLTKTKPSDKEKYRVLTENRVNELANDIYIYIRTRATDVFGDREWIQLCCPVWFVVVVVAAQRCLLEIIHATTKRSVNETGVESKNTENNIKCSSHLHHDQYALCMWGKRLGWQKNRSEKKNVIETSCADTVIDEQDH